MEGVGRTAGLMPDLAGYISVTADLARDITASMAIESDTSVQRLGSC